MRGRVACSAPKGGMCRYVIPTRLSVLRCCRSLVRYLVFFFKRVSPSTERRSIKFVST